MSASRESGLAEPVPGSAEKRNGLLALASRVEAASGPDAHLDAVISRAVGEEHALPLSYTASLDAALTLAGKYPNDRLNEARSALAKRFQLHMAHWPESESYTEWLARYVVAASLRARAGEGK